MTLRDVAYLPYADPDDFIREVTDLIWVQRDISHIYDNYEPNSIVHGPLGTATGVEQVVQGSMMRIAQTPSHVGQAEDVIWEARGDDAFLSSHLVLGIDPIPTTTGLVTVRSRTIANCLYRRGRMVEEWVVRDSLAHCLQMGIDPAQAARAATFVGYTPGFSEPPPQDVLACGDSGPRPDDHRAECETVLAMIDGVWNRRNLSLVGEYFERDLVLSTVGDRTVVRPHGYQEDFLRLIQAFPDAVFEMRDVQTHHAERYGGLRVAVVWKMVGRYTGVADYGPLTGERIELLGVSQFQFHRGRIVREVRIFDTVGLIAQIDATRGEREFVFDNLY